jgi:hypothetical protein
LPSVGGCWMVQHLPLRNGARAAAASSDAFQWNRFDNITAVERQVLVM